MSLPTFRYHPDPLATGSVKASDTVCRCCRKARGFIYTGPVYSETELDEAICPWCIADGKASRKFEAVFFDAESCAEEIPESVIEEICERTPAFDTWQQGHWPACCGDATAYLGAYGIAEIRRDQREWEGMLMGHIVHEMGISGGAATRLLNALDRDKGPTLHAFRCLSCDAPRFHIDQP